MLALDGARLTLPGRGMLPGPVDAVIRPEAIRIAAPMPADDWPVSRGETPRSSPASTWRKLRPMPRCAPT